jgi:hypothetical protein
MRHKVCIATEARIATEGPYTHADCAQAAGKFGVPATQETCVSVNPMLRIDLPITWIAKK